MGRRSIPIQPIRDERNRSVTFVKRKAGLFKKAHELSVLCQVEIALVIVGANGKIFEFSSSSVDQVMKRYKKTEVQEFKTTKDFSNQRHYNHSRKSSQIDSDDEDETIKDEYYQQQPQQSLPSQSQQPVVPPQAGVAPQAQASSQVPTQSQQQQQPVSSSSSGSLPPPVQQASQQQQQPQQTSSQQTPQPQVPQQVVPLLHHHHSQIHGHPPPPMSLASHARPKLTVQIPHATQEEAKKQPSGWTPQRQLLGQWAGQDQGVSPTGPYYQVQSGGQMSAVGAGGVDPHHHHQQQQHHQRMAMQNGDPTPVSTTLPSKYMMDSMQSPSNFFSSEWGVPWSANPNSSFMRPGPMSQPHMAGPANAAAGGISGQPGPISQQQQQDPRQIPGMYLPPNVNVYSGGMPSAGVQTMFQSSPVQFTPNDAKRKADEPIQGDVKRKDF